ncbi:MAG: hypothetical protein R3F65_30035, partial [bacterium]
MIDYTEPHRRWVFTLEIAGLTTRWTSGPVTPTAIQGHPLGALYDDRHAIVAVSPMRSSLDLVGGVAEHGPVTITLATAPGEAHDPADLLSRVGRRSATLAAQLTATLPAGAELPVTISVDRDLSGLTLPTYLHVGQEMVWITAALGSDPDPAAADPFRVTVAGRGLGGTRVRTHTAVPETGDLPAVTGPEVVFWRTRPARLLVEDARALGSPCEVFRGFVDRSPQIDSDGTTVRLELVPLTALLDKESETRIPASRTTLVEGYHLFTDDAAHFLEVYQRQAEIQGVTRDATAAGSGALDVHADDADLWQRAFDPALPPAHPRAGSPLVGHGGAPLDVAGVAADGGAVPETLTLAAGPPDPVRAGSGWHVPPRVEARRAYIIEPGGAPEVLVWPGTDDDGLSGAFGRLNAQLDVDTHLGASGAAYGVRLDGSGVEEPVRLLRNAETGLDREPFFPVVFFAWDDHLSRGRGRRRDFLPVASLWPRNGELGPSPPEAWGEVGGVAVRLPPATTRDLLWYPFEWVHLGHAERDSAPVVRGEAADRNASAVPVAWVKWSLAGDERTVRVAEIAPAFYQGGETRLLVEEEIDISLGYIAVVYTVNDSRGVIRFTASAIEPMVLAAGPRAGDTVYAITVAPVEDSFSVLYESWRFSTVEVFGGAEATALLTWDDDNQSAADALEYLLTSPAALGLSSSDVDVASLHRWRAPWLPTFDVAAAGAGDGATFGDILGSILRMTRTALVMRTDAQGRCRLTRIPVGVESAVDAVARIDAGDWAAGVCPTWGTDDEIINRLEIEHGRGLVEGSPEDFLGVVSFIDQASRAAHDESQSVELADYSGIAHGDPAIDLLPLAQGIFRTFGEPRRTWAGEVGTFLGILLGIGAVATVSSPHLRSYRPPGGVHNGVGRVISQEIDLWHDGCKLDFVHFGASGTGWNAAAEVVEVLDAFSVRVAANAFSDPEHPATGAPQEDLDLFADVKRH